MRLTPFTFLACAILLPALCMPALAQQRIAVGEIGGYDLTVDPASMKMLGQVVRYTLSGKYRYDSSNPGYTAEVGVDCAQRTRIEYRGQNTMQAVLEGTQRAREVDAVCLAARDMPSVAAAPAMLAAQVAQAAPPPQQPALAPSARRKALVIGNDSYRGVTRLNNARADAQAIAAALGRLGFAVTLRTDLDERMFKQALRGFRAEVRDGDEVVVYFAGHGVQLAGANYLLPIDIRGDNEEQVKDEALPLQRVLDDLAERKAGFTLAIVDACRDNPFKGSGRSIGSRGLAPTTAATGQMVIFSAGSGQQALDRLGPQDRNPNGLFTRVFLQEMERPDVSVDRVLRNVRSEVVKLARSAGHEQTPALYDQAVGDFYFRRNR
jgi:hypothetical protein